MRSLEKKENVLYVYTLGGFHMEWNGLRLAGGAKATDSQSAYLLQLLIHEYPGGVPRGRLESLLFEDRDILDPHHTLQSIVYNTKKKLERAGLPHGSYIEQRAGVYYWSGLIETVEDAAAFEWTCNEAHKTQDKDEKLALLMDACHMYSGDFLPMHTTAVWAVQEARRYKSLFCACVEEAHELLRREQDFFQMEDLGRYAARVDPLADWETITMEALASMGRYDEARKLYDDTVQYYLNEEGLRPSDRMMEQFERLAIQMKHQHAALDTIQTELTGQFDDHPGGYYCSYPVFQGIYRMIERMIERGGQSVYLMLCTVVDGKGNPMKQGAMLDELSRRMGDAVRGSIRRGDAMTQYGRGQYLVLLVNTTRENCTVIQKRINKRFIIGRQRSGIEYYVNSVFWSPMHRTTDQSDRRDRP